MSYVPTWGPGGKIEDGGASKPLSQHLSELRSSLSVGTSLASGSITIPASTTLTLTGDVEVNGDTHIVAGLGATLDCAGYTFKVKGVEATAVNCNDTTAATRTLTAQLGAWALASGRAARRGLWIIAGGMAIEALLVIPAAQLVAPDAVCATGTMLACLDGPFVAIMLPAAVTAALILCWLNPMAAALRGRGRS